MRIILFNNESNLINIESWFIPLDIFMIITSGISLILSLIYLFIIIIDKGCHTIAMILVANSCLSQFVFGIDMFGMALFTLTNDLKGIHHEDSLCVFRGFLGYIVTSLQNYSYLLQSIYRYLIVVYPTRLLFQSIKFHIILILLSWILGILCPIPYLLTNSIKYDIENEICQMRMELSFLNIYNAFCVYCIPISLTIFIYLKLVRYVHQTSLNINSTNNILRAQRELQMVRRIVILIIGVATIGLPYAIFVFIAFFTNPPKYHFRIAYIFVDASLAFVIILTFIFNQPIKTFIIHNIYPRRNIIQPIIP